MNLYEATIPIFEKFLSAAAKWLDKIAEDSAARKYEPSVILNARLAPDQYNFIRQIQSACDTAKFAAAKMTGKEAPAHPDTEQTLDELRSRIATVRAYLQTFKREDFDNCAERRCGHAWMGSKTMRAADYLDHFVLPNFHFHLTTAYSILRHNGYNVGKMDYILSLPLS